jgi:YceI-like domain
VKQKQTNMNRLRINTTLKLTAGLLGILLVMLFASPATAQVNYTASNVTLKVSGTSNLHDWDIKSATASVSANITVNTVGAITALSALNFTTPVINLKSEHNGMDKNTYKALKKDANPTISFVSKTAIITGNTVKCHGTLTIAGKGVETELVATYKVNADKTITVTGTKSINMIDYGVAPPTALLGTIKTGKDVVLSFIITLK